MIAWAIGAVAAVGLCVAADPSAAQQASQTFTLQPGWNAIFLEVRPDPNDTASVFGGIPGPVESVWSWNPSLQPADYIEDPSEAATMWNEDLWLRYFAAPEKAVLTNLFRVLGNRAYLVQLGGSDPVEWTVVGRPALRPIRWVPDAYNLVGFPVDPALPPAFGDFFADAPAHQPGQAWSLSPGGVWAPVAAGDPVESGRAYWVYSDGMSDFNAPVEVRTEGGDGLDYDIFLERRNVRIRNRGGSAATLIVSGGAASGALAYEKFDPAANAGTGGFVWPELGTALVLPLEADAERVLRIGVRRALFPEDRFEAVLVFRDGLGTRWRVPLEADRPPAGGGGGGGAATAAATPPTGGPTTGLWIGTATVNRVGEVNPPSADLSFDLDLRLPGTRSACEGGDSAGATCSGDTDCAGFDQIVACGPDGLCTGGPDEGRACVADPDCANAGDPVAACVERTDPVFLRGGDGFGSGRIGAVWRYHDSGIDLHASAWKTLTYDDSEDAGWKEGVGEFGFGDPDANGDGAPDEATPLASTCVGACDVGVAERPPTYYFRSVFDVPALADWTVPPTAIELSLLADDGAVLWLNGTEITRVNMDPGAVSFATSASSPLASSEEVPTDLVLPVGALLFGQPNVLAVEVHQHASEAIHEQLVCDGGPSDGLACVDDSSCGGGSCVAEPVTDVAETTPTVFRSGGSEAQLRLIVHVDGQGQARLLKQVIQMRDGDHYVLLTDDGLIPSFQPISFRDDADFARRVSAVAFDFADEDPDCPGCLRLAQSTGTSGPVLSGTAVLPPTHPTNPFYHRFHPDHDNLDADFEEIELPGDFDPAEDPSPFESYAITREIALEFTPFDAGGDELAVSPGWGDTEIGGIYRETITGLHKQPIRVEGTFELFRPPSSRIDRLNPAPPGAGQ